MIGLLALQGNFHAHKQILESLKISSMEIRYPDQLNGVEGLIIPGGESTTINDLMTRVGFHDAIKSFAANTGRLACGIAPPYVGVNLDAPYL